MPVININFIDETYTQRNIFHIGVNNDPWICPVCYQQSSFKSLTEILNILMSICWINKGVKMTTNDTDLCRKRSGRFFYIEGLSPLCRGESPSFFNVFELLMSEIEIVLGSCYRLFHFIAKNCLIYFIFLKLNFNETNL